jgi:hypothetical protein
VLDYLLIEWMGIRIKARLSWARQSHLLRRGKERFTGQGRKYSWLVVTETVSLMKMSLA